MVIGMEDFRDPSISTPGSGSSPGSSPLGRAGSHRQILPFAVVAFGGFLSVLLGTGIQRPALVFIAFALTSCIVVSTLMLPWERIPRRWHAAPALSYYVVVALLRHAAGGSDSGFAPLVFVPILWLSLYGRRNEMLAAVGATVVVFTLPQLLAVEGYSSSEWRRALLFVLVGLTAGHVIQSLLGTIRASEVKAVSQARELARAQAEFQAAFDNSPIGMAIVDMEGNYVQVNDRLCAILGRDADQVVGSGFRPMVHPEDLVGIEAAFERFIDSGECSYQGERRYVHPDGRIVHAVLSSTLVLSPEGDPSHMFVQVMDVSAERESRERIQRSSQTVRSLMQATRAVTGHDNPREAICAAALNVSDAHLVALVEPDGDFFDITASAGQELPPVRINRRSEPSGSGVAFASRKRYFVADAGSSPAVSASLVEATGVRSVLFEPIIDGGGRAIGVLVVGWSETMSDIDDELLEGLQLLAADAAVAIDRADLMGRLEEMARTDALTGLPNRRVVDEELGRELARAARSGQPMCVAMLDLDHFKSYNDTYGHQAGDVALKEAASGWAGELRATDMLGRYGGEEFVVLLPHGSAGEAQEVLARLQKVRPGGLTFSGGLAEWDGSESPAQLLVRADSALYEAKAAGRDTVRLASSTTPEMA